MKILITGCRGFIGGAIGRWASNTGHEVLGVSRATQAPADWPGQYIPADVVSADLSPVITDFAPDAIFHAAGTASVQASFAAPLEDLRAAVLAWANLLDAARRSGTRPLLLFPSSAAVYGNPRHLPVAEDAPVQPISPYGFHKAACELIAREYAECFGARVIICRFFSVFGAAQRRLFVWDVFQQLISDAPAVSLQGTGRETRDYLYIEDAASAIVKLIERFANSEAPAHLIVNVASGVETQVMELAEQIRDRVAREKQINCRGEERPGDPINWRADNSRLRAMIPQWQPKSLSDRLSECIAAWQEKTK